MTALTSTVLAATGSAATTLAGVLAQAAPSTDALAPYLTTGGTLSLAGVVVYALRKMVNGDLVAWAVKEREERLVQLVTEGQARERAMLAELAAAGEERVRLRSALERNSEALWAASAHDRRRAPHQPRPGGRRAGDPT